MNKARSFSEFYSYLEWNAIPGYNIGYADRNDTIFYISNGKIPKRDSSYDWQKVVPGNTKKRCGTAIIPPKNCHKSLHQNRAMCTTPITVHFSQLHLMKIQIQMRLQKP